MTRLILICAVLLLRCDSTFAQAKTLRVPSDHASIQSAINAANHGDTVLVAEGRYRERVVMKDGVTLKSVGDESAGTKGLRRAERTIIDGSASAKGAGVTMANGAVLDGFTVTGIGQYDAKKWEHHHATQGNEQNYEHIGGGPGTPGIAVSTVNCIVRNNIVHHIGYTGILISGDQQQDCSPVIADNVCYRNMGGGIGSVKKSTATIRNNVCFENFYAGIGHSDASPLVFENTCYANIRAGIGISEGACPVVQGNKCYGNRRSGIGIRTLNTRPIIKDNDCYKNDMAGIGSEEHAAPTIIGNRCYGNQLAGIGSRRNARSTIIDNECYENGTVGIGQESDAVTIVTGNHCHDNQAAGIGFAECTSGRSTLTKNRVINNAKVAIGIRAGWNVTATGNELSRVGGIAPIVMVFAGSQACFVENKIQGSGVAGIRVSGQLHASCNTFVCPIARKGGPPNIGIWALNGSSVSQSGNTFDGWRDNVRIDGAN